MPKPKPATLKIPKLVEYIRAHPGVRAADIPRHLRSALRPAEQRGLVEYRRGRYNRLGWHIAPPRPKCSCCG